MWVQAAIAIGSAVLGAYQDDRRTKAYKESVKDNPNTPPPNSSSPNSSSPNSSPGSSSGSSSEERINALNTASALLKGGDAALSDAQVNANAIQPRDYKPISYAGRPPSTRILQPKGDLRKNKAKRLAENKRNASDYERGL